VTPEFDLTPEEINDPKSMQLWIARPGTPLPTAWNSGIDPTFQFAGMVRRDLKPRQDTPETFTPHGLARPFFTCGQLQLTLTWPRLLPRHAAAIPAGVYCSLVLAMPAPQDRTVGVMPRVRFGLLDLGLPFRDRAGAPASCVVEPETEAVKPYRVAMAWFTAAPIWA
jgi:hypothetical protein